MDFLGTAIRSIGADPSQPTCPECGGSWRPSVDEATRTIRGAPADYAAALRAGDPYRIAAPLTWSASTYTWHVADVCSAWAERAVALALEPSRSLAGFDQEELASARNYHAMSAAAAAWALESAVARLLAEVIDAGRAELAFHHPDWGQGTLADGLRWVAHELVHHEGDVRRSVAG